MGEASQDINQKQFGQEGNMNNKITTNDRFDRLCNNDISTHYRDINFYVMPSCLMGAFAYWVVYQHPNNDFIGNNDFTGINPALVAFEGHILSYFKNPLLPEEMTYDLLASIINEDSFAEIPYILALNDLKPDFIDLGALARNVFYMVLREHITQG